MKTLTCFIILSLTIISTGFSQTTQDISFVHGLDGTTTTWDYMENQLLQQFIFNPDDVFYNDHASIPTAAASTFFPSNTVTIAHSLGGLMAREYIRQNGNNSMKALIAVGTPHLGAPAADVAQSNTIAGLASRWYHKLIDGPLVMIYIAEVVLAEKLGLFPYIHITIPGLRQAWRDFVHNTIMEAIGVDPQSIGSGIAGYLRERYGAVASVDEMRPDSPFLNTLNASPDATLPQARYAIYGQEDFYGFVRLFGSFINNAQNNNPREPDIAMKIFYAAGGLYLYMTSWSIHLSTKFQRKANEVGIFDEDYEFYQTLSDLFEIAASEWFKGFWTLAVVMPVEWKLNITKSAEIISYDPLKIRLDHDDALLSRGTQAPEFFQTLGFIDRTIRASGANHLEEVVHPSVKRRLIEIFGYSDVNIDEIDEGDDPINPPTFPEPCYDENGNQIICPTYN